MQHVIEQIALDNLTTLIKECPYVVMDSNVRSLFFSEACFDHVIEVTNPEAQKCLAGYEHLLNELLDTNISRDASVLVVGGGALSDLAGFVAATVLRGVHWEVVPSTLLAMIDAALGGKTGINTKHGKNQVGSFHLPKKVYLCSELLKHLPEEHFKSGLGELSKYALLSEKIHYDIFNQDLATTILSCASYKQEIVNQDLKESGLRMLLNLGHTLGHAFEVLERIPHGIAVAKGIQGILSLYAQELQSEYQNVLTKLGVEVTLPKGNFTELEQLLNFDKKRKADTSIQLVIPRKVGDVQIVTKTIDSFFADIRKNEYFRYFS